jgi:hypothetical protein
MKKYTLILLLVLGTSIAMATGNEDDKKEKKTPDLPGIILVDFGFNFFKEAPSQMDINWFKSKSFGIYYMKTFRLGKKLTFNPAIGVNFEKYGFTKDVSIGYPITSLGQPAVTTGTQSDAVPNTYGDLSILDLSYLQQIDKSQLAMSYIDIPVQFRYYFKGNDTKGTIYLAAGGMLSMLVESHTKLKYTDGGRSQTTKQRDDFNQNKFRYGVQGRFGIGSFNFFYKHYFSTVFNSEGPAGATDITTHTIGISVSGL